MTNTKVIHVTTVHAADDVRIFRKECVSLASAGFDVTLVAPNVENQVVSGVRLLGSSKRHGRLGRMIFTTWQSYRLAKGENPDIYHIHDPELLPFGLLLLWTGKQVIYDAHEDLPRQILSKYWIPLPFRKVVSLVAERIENFIARRLSGVIAATPCIAARFSFLNPRTVDINNYPLPDELAPGGGPSDRKPQICYVGGISRIRGIRPLVEALQYTGGLKLALCGRFSEPDLRAELEELPGWANVDYLGHVNRATLQRIMSESIAGIVTFLPLPNHIDAQPNKMFEYMSAGLPVIASDFPLWREIIDGARAGLCVDPQSPEAIAAAIMNLRDHTGLAEELGGNGRNAVLTRFNWAREAQKLIKFYREML